jgi:hypothetical protein
MRGWVAAIAAGILLAGCGSSDTDTTQTSTSTSAAAPEVTVSSWGKEQLAPSLDSISDAFTWIGGAMQSRDLADARAGCRKLDADVDALEAKLPSPDAQLTDSLDKAVYNLREYSHICQGLNPGMPPQKFDEMSRFQQGAEAAMNRAVEIVQAAQQSP